MCYSAEAWQDYKHYVREFGADVDMKEFVRLYLDRDRAVQKGKKKTETPKIPKGMDASFAKPKTDAEKEVHGLIEEWNQREIGEIEQDLFAQKKRLADAERKLAVKETKGALNEQRVSTNKIEQNKNWLADLKRSAVEPKDSRIFPMSYAPVLIVEDGKKIVRPMRYLLRPPGAPPSFDFDQNRNGTYNARRDNLTRYWKKHFGYTHGLMVANHFWENVEDESGKNIRLKFTPRTGDPLLIACLWSKWESKGDEPDLYSYAAITDDPEPEVAAAGHDRTIVNIKPEYVDAWLTPDPENLDAMFAIFDDKQHPYYEHKKAA